jgi:hypothetical protein
MHIVKDSLLRVAVMALAGLLVSASAAVAAVDVFAMVYFDDEVTEDGLMVARGYHSAHTDVPEGHVCVDGWLKSPTGAVLDEEIGTCAFAGGGVAVGTSATLDFGAMQEGNYEAVVAGADSQGAHGCGSSTVPITMFSANYQHVQVIDGQRSAYSRCDTGPCLSMTVRRVSGYVGAWPPPFLRLSVARVGYPGGAACFAMTMSGIPSC